MERKVAVVILNYNTCNFLRDFLPSVCATEYDKLEVVVADNHSDDGSVEWVRGHFPRVRIIELDRNYGFTGGYNRALAQVEADFFVLLNSDVEVDKNWLQPMVDLALSDQKIAAVQPKLISWHERDKFEYAGASGGFIDRYGFPFCRGRIFDSIETDTGQYDDSCEVFWASGAALFIRASVYRELQGLDEDFFAHMEEIDLCWRIRNAGMQVWCCPQSRVFHVGGGTLQKSNPRKTYYNFRNGLILLLKNLPKGKVLPVILIRLLLDHVAAYRFLLQGKTGDFKAIAAAHRHFILKLGTWKKKRKVVNGNQAYKTLVLQSSIVWLHFVRKMMKYTGLRHKISILHENQK